MAKFARYIIVLDRRLDDVGEKEHDGTGAAAAQQLFTELAQASATSCGTPRVTGRTIMDSETAPSIYDLHAAYQDDPETCTNCTQPISRSGDNKLVHVLTMQAACTLTDLPPDFQSDVQRGIAEYVACPELREG